MAKLPNALPILTKPSPLKHRRALLLFADNLGLDLARRRLPRAALPLIRSHETSTGVGEADLHLFTTNTSATEGSAIHRQSGVSFGERLENAIETLAARGYEEIVAIGRDCPELCAADIALAFEQLSTKRLVLGPDHNGGCYLIALRVEDRDLLRGVRWKRNTDCAELRARVGETDVFLLEVKHDIDTWSDLRLFARTGSAAGRLATFLVEFFWIAARGFASFVDLAAQAVRVRGQMPPPEVVAPD